VYIGNTGVVLFTRHSQPVLYTTASMAKWILLPQAAAAEFNPMIASVLQLYIAGDTTLTDVTRDKYEEGGLFVVEGPLVLRTSMAISPNAIY
jgi:hypothetical protein